MVERVRVRTGAAVLAPIKRGDLVHVLRAELEVEDLEVLLHTRRRHRLGKHRSARVGTFSGRAVVPQDQEQGEAHSQNAAD